MKLPDPALFRGMPQDVAARWMEYFYYTPRAPDKVATLKPRVFAFYDPFAKRSIFPAGVRYCVNVYVGCEHRCRYCYTRNFIVNMEHPRTKKRLLAQAKRDLQAMVALQLPPVPLHMSNSTDPFQTGLETQTRNTLSLMQLIAEHRQHFTN